MPSVHIWVDLAGGGEQRPIRVVHGHGVDCCVGGLFEVREIFYALKHNRSLSRYFCTNESPTGRLGELLSNGGDSRFFPSHTMVNRNPSRWGGRASFQEVAYSF